MDDPGKWQKRFDPCWFLMLRIASPLIDQELRDMNSRPRTVIKGRLQRKESRKVVYESPVVIADRLRDAMRDILWRLVSIFLPFNASLEFSLIPLLFIIFKFLNKTLT